MCALAQQLTRASRLRKEVKASGEAPLPAAAKPKRLKQQSRPAAADPAPWQDVQPEPAEAAAAEALEGEGQELKAFVLSDEDDESG